jgi:tRNA modification GTPase
MNTTEDTIVAVVTPEGYGGIAVVRISGKEAINTVNRLFRGNRDIHKMETQTVAVGEFLDQPKGKVIDQVVVTLFRKPHSYTGEDIVEISCHGGKYLAKLILEGLLNQDTRLAEPGEFTKRAFLNGKMDLTQAEAVADIIQAKTRRSLQIAIQQLQGKHSKDLEAIRTGLMDLVSNLELELDFVEENIELKSKEQMLVELNGLSKKLEQMTSSFKKGRFVHDGVRTVIAGKPNVGKSSLLNAILGYERAIVDESPGTTRDTIETQIDINGVLFRLFDTAGIRETSARIEQRGINFTEQQIKRADIILFLLDCPTGYGAEDHRIWQQIDAINSKNRRIFPAEIRVLWNKVDLTRPPKEALPIQEDVMYISAKTGRGLKKLHQYFCDVINQKNNPFQHQIITNLRHYHLLKTAGELVSKATKSVMDGMSNEFISMDLRAALDAVGEIIGKTSTEDILNHIFANFCIGK